MRLLCVPNELPLPANAGGRVDVWRRLQLLQGMGCDLALLSWYDAPRDGAPGPATLAQLQQVCPQVLLQPIRRSPLELLQRLAWLGRLPSHAAARWVTLDRPQVLAWARAFAPDVLLLDGLYGAPVVRWLADALGLPWLYRAHNLEHVYMQRQWASATGWRARAGLAANLPGLRALEHNTVAAASQVLDISPADLQHWQACGHHHVQWLPTVVDAGFVAGLQAASRQPAAWDMAYFGNLNTPNNVAAVRWLVQQVLPLLGAQCPSLLLAGSRPSDAVRALAASNSRITLMADPPDMPALVGAARVLLNPVQAGSGVNLKSVEMLFSRAALVSTPAGVLGLPAAAAACFEVRADPAGFAQAVQAAVLHGAPGAAALAARHSASAPFAPAAAAAVLGQVLALATGRAA